MANALKEAYGPYITKNNNSLVDKQYSTRRNELKETYGQAFKNLENRKYASMQDAYIQRQKDQRNLGYDISTQGFAGSGMSETSKVNSLNNYRNQIGGIESDYRNNESELSRRYKQALFDLDNGYYEKKQTEYDKRLATTRELLMNYLGTDEKEMDDIENIYGDEYFERGDRRLLEYYKKATMRENHIADGGTVSGIESGILDYSKSNDELLASLESNKAKMTNAVYNNLRDKITSRPTLTTDFTLSDNHGGKDTADAGKKYKITIGGEQLWVKSGGESADVNAVSYAQTMGEGTMFMYNGSVYIKSGGKVYSIVPNKQSDYDNLINHISNPKSKTEDTDRTFTSSRIPNRIKRY